MTRHSAEQTHHLDHPLIDADGHTIEYLPLVYDLMRDLGGAKAVDGFRALTDGIAMIRSVSPEVARTYGAFRVGWWGLPTEALDRATVMLPRLYYERLPEIGFDFAVCYPTYGLMVSGIHDPDVRLPAARAFNRYFAAEYGPYADRLAAAAIIPVHDPAEAVAELDYAVGELGLKVVMLNGHVVRPRPGSDDPRRSGWVDTLGVDSAHDYDPLWRRCAELRVAPTFHSAGLGFATHDSPTNYVFNKIGAFAASQQPLCRSIFFGGIAHRFPSLRFAFLEAGVGWACALYADLLSHWEKRNIDAVQRYNPARLDRPALRELFRRYGSDSIRARTDALDDSLHVLSDPGDPAVDDFALSGVRGPDDIRALFTSRFFFGCEADDRINAWAFDRKTNPLGARLNALFASDVGHWDVPDLRRVVAEAYELVDEGLITAADFRAFVFENPVGLWGGANPDFFAGTAIEREAAAQLQRLAERDERTAVPRRSG